jgi:hypothetical protein
MPFYDYRDEPEMLRDAAMRAKAKPANMADALTAKRLGDIYARHPYMQAGVALSLAEAGADMAMVDQVANKSAIVAAQKAQAATEGSNDPRNPANWEDSTKTKLLKKGLGAIGKGLSWLGGNTLGRSSKIKTASRWAVAVAQFGPEYIANYMSLKTDPDEAAKRASADSRWALPDDMWASTSLGALFQNGSDAGEGFFVGGKAEEKRLEAVKRFRWQVNGESYTVGRGTANMMFTPGSKPYSFLSGLIDGGIAILGDVTLAGGKVVKGAKAAKAVIPAVQTADEISAAAKLARGAAGLLTTAEQHAIDTGKFFNWVNNSKVGQRIVKKAAEETDAYRMLEAFDFRISVDDAMRLAATKTEDEVKGILGEAATRLKDETDAIPFATSTQQLPIARRIPAYRLRNQSRWLAQVPDRMLLVNGTPEESAKAVKNMGNFLKTLKVDPYSGDGKKLMDLALKGFAEDGTKVDKDILVRAFLGDPRRGTAGIVELALREAGGYTPEQITGVLDEFRAGLQELRKYAFDTAGLTDDNQLAIHLTEMMTDDELYKLLRDIHPMKTFPGMSRLDMDDVVANLQPGQLTIHGPMSLSQMLNNVVVLPDPRQLRRMTNNDFFRLTADGRELGAKQVALFLQQEVWRPYALMTVGYMVRNSMDAYMRLGLNGYLSNPFDFILMGLGKRGLGTIGKGERWSDAGEETIEAFDELDEFRRLTRQRSQRYGEDPAKQMAHLIKTRQVAVLEPSDAAYGQGLLDQGRLMAASPEQRFYAQIMHLPVDKQHELFVKWLDSGSKEARIARKTIVDYLRDGPVVANRANGRVRRAAPISAADSLTTDEIVELWFEQGNKWQVDNFTQQTDELRTVVGYQDVPVAPSEIWDEAMVRSKATTAKRPRPGDLLVEDVTIDVDNPQFRYWRVLETDVVPASGGKTVRNFKVIEVVDPGQAMKPDAGTPAMNDFINKLLADNASRNPADPMRIPERVLARVRVDDPARGLAGTLGQGFLKYGTFLPKWFFDNVVGNWEQMIDRSPAYKTAYYNAVADNANLLSSSEGATLLSRIEDFAARDLPSLYAKDPEAAMIKWIGGKDIYKRIKAGVAGAKGTGTVDQLQEYASVRARRDLEDLFFQSVNKNNFADATQLIAPFGAAWANVVGRYAREAIQDPTRLRKAQLLYRGLEDFDPDQDGRGFIWKDPTSGQMKFTFPLYGTAIKMFTGIPNIEMAAPVNRLSAGMTAIPAVGPLVQMAASEVFDSFPVPNLDTWRKFVTPYGNVGFKSMFPGSIQKTYDAIFGDPSKVETVYGNTYVDVFRHLSASGEYDLTDANDQVRLNEDAKSKARVIAFIRAAGQFIGPTAPSPDYRYQKGSGQYYYTSMMINQFRDWQAEDYDTAVEKFLNTFGDQALIYITGKTEVMEPYGGIDATEQFAMWERQNKDLVQTHKETAGYLAPGGVEADFSMPVWSRQIAAGMRRRVDPLDQLAAAQYTAAAALYRARRKEYGPVIDANEKAALAGYRAELIDKYPGFETAASFDTKGFDRMLGNLRELLEDDRTADNPVAETTRKYLKLRDQAVAELKQNYNVTLKSEKNSRAVQLKEFLYAYGEDLAVQNPDFSRLWQRELSAEVED